MVANVCVGVDEFRFTESNYVDKCFSKRSIRIDSLIETHVLKNCAKNNNVMFLMTYFLNLCYFGTNIFSILHFIYHLFI